MKKLRGLKDYSAAWKNGEDCRHIMRDGYVDCDDPYCFLELTKRERRELLTWIESALVPRKGVCRVYNSYGIKHIYEEETGNYVTNGQFKGAMVVAGYEPYDPTALNANYRISGVIRARRRENA